MRLGLMRGDAAGFGEGEVLARGSASAEVADVFDEVVEGGDEEGEEDRDDGDDDEELHESEGARFHKGFLLPAKYQDSLGDGEEQAEMSNDE